MAEAHSAFEVLTSIVQIFLVNLALSGDNAVVIALAASRLPHGQRRQAVFWGITFAVLLRIILTCAATFLVSVPGLMLAGGLVLYFIACKLLIEEDAEQAAARKGDDASPSNLAAAVKMICVADLAMSLDNVLAVAGASGGDQFQMIVGMVSSVLLIVLLSNLIATVMDRYRWLVYAGAGILAYTAAEMVVSSHEAAIAWGEGKQLVSGILMSAGLFSSTPDLPHVWLSWPLQAIAIGGCLWFGFVKRRSRLDASESGIGESSEFCGSNSCRAMSDTGYGADAECAALPASAMEDRT